MHDATPYRRETLRWDAKSQTDPKKLLKAIAKNPAEKNPHTQELNSILRQLTHFEKQVQSWKPVTAVAQNDAQSKTCVNVPLNISRSQELCRIMQQLSQLSEQIKTLQTNTKTDSNINPSEEAGYKTDPEDEKFLERQTTQFFASQEVELAPGPCWSKPVNSRPGLREVRSDIATHDKNRLSLYHFLKNRKNRAVQEVENPDGSMQLMTELAVKHVKNK